MGKTDYKKKIMNYLNKNKSKGYDLETLKWALLNQGYSRALVESSVKQVYSENEKKINISEEKPMIKYEVFDEKNNPVLIKKSWWKRIFSR